MYPAYRKLKNHIRSFELGTKFDCLRQKYEKIFKKQMLQPNQETDMFLFLF